MNSHTISAVVESQLCSGCGTCHVLCPHHAIEMRRSSLGRLLPVVDERQCSRCGKCLKACPGIDLSGQFQPVEEQLIGDYRGLYFGKSTTAQIFDCAQSGGAVTAVLTYLFNSHLIDAALLVTQRHLQACCYVATSVEELAQSQASQYTPIDLVSYLPLLSAYDRVAVVGLPCHIEGLVKLRQIRPDLCKQIAYLFGLICGGTLSHLSLDVISSYGKIRMNPKTDYVYWRHKKFSSYKQADLVWMQAGNTSKKIDRKVRHLAKQYLTPPRCLLCHDKMNMFCDIAFGDCWGIEGKDTTGGGNLIISRSVEGDQLLQAMHDAGQLYLRSCSLHEVINGQGLNKKKRMVGQALAAYAANSWSLPGWAQYGGFRTERHSASDVSHRIDDYVRRDRQDVHRLAQSIVRSIRKKLLWKRIKHWFHALIK